MKTKELPVEPIDPGSPLGALVARHKSDLLAHDIAKDLEFAIDFTEPKAVILARFDAILSRHWTS